MADTPSWLSSDDHGGGGDNTFEMNGGEPMTTIESRTPSSSDMNGGGLDSGPGGSIGTGATGASSAAGTSSSSSDDEKDLPGTILFMRLANMAAAILIVVASILLLISLPNPAGFVLAIYASCGGILICCLETQLKFLRVMLAVNFGFLFNSFWRFLFYILLASVTWNYKGLLGKITAGVLVGMALFNTYVLCRYPTYRKIREKIAEEEDKRIEARISKEVKRQAARQVMGGA